MKNIRRIALGAALVASAGFAFAPAAFADDSSGNTEMHAAVGAKLSDGVSVPRGNSWSYTFASWDDGCSFGALPQVEIIQGPAHGSANLGQGEHVVKNPLSICQGNNVEGTKLSYTPAPGFSGQDQITYKVAYQSTEGGEMNSNTYTVRLNVQ